MAFLDSLTNAFNEQLGIGDQAPRTFSYNELGPFSAKLDRTAHRVYLDTGIVGNSRARIMETIWQQPDMTVVFKKRHFSSLAENFRLDLLNEEEKMYLRAVKYLIQRKCKLISKYEQLSKFDYLASQGIINNYSLPLIFSAVDFINQAKPGLISGSAQSSLEQIRQVYSLSNPNLLTTWVVTNSIPSILGDGTGVFELTTVKSANWTNSIKFGGGGADLTIEDPLKLTIITSQDIDQAIADASSLFQSAFFKQTEAELQDAIEQVKQSLSQSRINRNVSQIKIFINENPLLHKKVRLIMEEEGKEINFNFDPGVLGFGNSAQIDPLFLDGKNALTQFEVILLEQLIKNIYTLLTYQQNSKSQIYEFNGKNKYLRQRLEQEFCNLNIIQNMDQVHIFVSSKTRIDQNALQGFNITFSDNSLLSQLDQSAGKLQDSINNFASGFGQKDDSYLEQEKNAIAGEDFPLWLWTFVRNDFTRNSAGQHRFAGVIDGVSESGGEIYSLRVSAKDNTYYLNMGQTNIKPALDVYDSAIFDPLTPFNLDFDSSNGLLKGEFPTLLDENIKLLNSGAIRYKTGRNIGKIVNSENFQNIEADKVASNFFRRKLNDPDGFVYRWKRGIQTQTLFGQPYSSLFRKEVVPSLTNDPFAGQDVMNVLSLLITGQPYNFNTFLKSSLISGNLSRDDLFNNQNTNSYFRSLISDIGKNNSLWGNFIPFKKMIINESGYNFLRSGEYDLSISNSKLNQLLSDRAKRFDALTSLLPQFANNPQFYKNGLTDISLTGLDLNSLSIIGQNIIELDFEIEQQKKIFEENLKNSNIKSKDGTLRIFGDEIFFDPTLTNESAITYEQKADQREKLRKKILSLTQRKLWKIKANEDVNFLIIDDSYDKNYDIQAFEKSLAGSLQTFRSTYTKVGEKIEGIAQMLGLEVFANTQGHIEIRPPQYNKIPSSVLAKMLREKKKNNFQLFPDFLQSLFFNQIQGLTNRLEILEDEIRLRGAALGFTSDDQFGILLSGAVQSATSVGNTKFTFVTDANGNLGGKDLQDLLIQSNPDVIEDGLKQALSVINSAIKFSNNSSINFDIVQKTKIVNELEFNLTKENKINDRIEEIRKRILSKSGITPLTKQQLLPNDKSIISGGRSQLDVLSLTNQISQFLSERQGLIKLLSNAVKNLDQGIQINEDPNLTKNLLYPTLYQKNKSFPEILEHLIEDETDNDLGENSGKRFILKDSVIKNYTITASPPPYTIVEVNGSLENALVQGPSGLEVGQGGNGISSAIAVHNDLWRQYGFRGYNSVYVPFLSDPETQCAPYAVWLLNQAQKNILHASISLIGNEYYQPGEVYYFEDRNLLFYAESISESFSYGQDYSCSMNLTYGHKPGEFIPTMLDLIGKGLYTNRFQGNLIKHVRNSSLSGEQHACVIVNDGTSINSESGELTGISFELFNGAYGKINQKSLSNLIILAGGYLGNQQKIELRIYHFGNGADSSLLNLTNSIKEYLVNPFDISQGTSEKIPLTNDQFSFGIPAENIDVVAVDLSSELESRSPSAAAWSSARNLNPESSIEVEKQNLSIRIIDIWVVGESSNELPTTKKIDNAGLNEKDQELKNKYIQQFNERLKQK